MRGAPCWRAMGGSAAMTTQLMPASSQQRVTMVAERWQVPQPPVHSTMSTPWAFSFRAISGPVSFMNYSTLPPPPMKV